MMSENFYLKFNYLKPFSILSVFKRPIIFVMLLLLCACSGGGGDEGTAPSDVSTYKLTVAKSGTGSGIASADNVNEIRCGDKCAYSYPKGTQVRLYTTPSDDSTFSGWSGGGCSAGDCIVTMNSDVNVVAAFNLKSIITWYKDADKDKYSDGTTKNSPTRPGDDYFQASELTAISGDCNDNNAGVHPGATEICGNGIDEDCNGSDLKCIPDAPANLKAAAGDAQVTVSWNPVTGADSYLVSYKTSSSSWMPAGETNTASETIGGLTNGITYSFVVQAKNAAGTSGYSAEASVSLVRYTLTVSKIGYGTGTVKSIGSEDISCGDNCSYSYPKGTQVTLSAKVDDYYHSTFAGWFGGGCGGIGDCVITMNDNQSVQAYFSPNQKVGICPGPGMFNNGSIQIVSIDPPPGTVLTRGSTVTFSGKVSYTTTLNPKIGLLYVGLLNLADKMVEIETVWVVFQHTSETPNPNGTVNHNGTIDFRGDIVIERQDGISTLDSVEVFARLLPIAPTGYLCSTMTDTSAEYPVK
jgi:hypothetical protein